MDDTEGRDRRPMKIRIKMSDGTELVWEKEDVASWTYSAIISQVHCCVGGAIELWKAQHQK